MAIALAVLLALVIVLAAVIGLATRRQRQSPRAVTARDPYTLSEPWRRFVMSAQGAQRRYRGALNAPPGPLHDRLAEIGARIDGGVDEVWRIAVRGAALDDAIGTIGAGAVGRRRDELPNDTSQPATAAALTAQEESAARLANTAREAKATLRLLDARLDEAVARGLELALTAGDTSMASGLDSDVATLVDEMEALRLALDEVSPGRTLPPGTATA